MKRCPAEETWPVARMLDWSPLRIFNGYAAWGEPEGAGKASLRLMAKSQCGCANDWNVHGHDHATAWSAYLPVADLKGAGVRWVVPLGV